MFLLQFTVDKDIFPTNLFQIWKLNSSVIMEKIKPSCGFCLKSYLLELKIKTAKLRSVKHHFMGKLQHIEASTVLDDSEIEVKCGLLSRVILGQNSIQLLDTALNDLFL